jgi:hypothetical protein
LERNIPASTKEVFEVMTMKTLALMLVIAGMLIAAGCSAPSALPAGTGTPAGEKVLPMSGNVTLGSGNKTVNVFLHSIELDAKADNESGRTLTIYVAAKNTGTEPVKLVWYSKLTDLNGNTYGGINVSHYGKGARTDVLPPGKTEAARDFIDQLTNQDLGVLSKGAVLDVYFFEKSLSNGTISQKPDYHAAWIIDPGAVLG